MDLSLQGSDDASEIFNFSALPDSGATRSIIDYHVLRRHGLRPDGKKREDVLIANGDTIECKGAINLAVEFQGHTRIVNTLVAVGLTEGLLLSWHDLKAFGVLPPDFPNSQLAPSVNKVNTVASPDASIPVPSAPPVEDS